MPPASHLATSPQTSADDFSDENMPIPPKLPSIITPKLLSSIRAHPNLPRHSWYFITSVTLSCLNRPDEIGQVWEWAVENGGDKNGGVKMGEDEQLRTVRRIREGLVKSAAVVGLPKVYS
jgi:hypothetical protein